MLDIVPQKPVCKLENKDLTSQEIDELCLNDIVQTWFYDEITSEPFSDMITKLDNLYKENKYDTDLDKFIADNFNTIYTPEEVEIWKNRFYLCAYLKQQQNESDLAQKFYSLKNNYTFLTNILRKSIYEYYVNKRWQLKNTSSTTNIFKKDVLPDTEFAQIQLDMIISTIENKWVK